MKKEKGNSTERTEKMYRNEGKKIRKLKKRGNYEKRK